MAASEGRWVTRTLLGQILLEISLKTAEPADVAFRRLPAVRTAAEQPHVILPCYHGYSLSQTRCHHVTDMK